MLLRTGCHYHVIVLRAGLHTNLGLDLQGSPIIMTGFSQACIASSFASLQEACIVSCIASDASMHCKRIKQCKHAVHARSASASLCMFALFQIYAFCNHILAMCACRYPLQATCMLASHACGTLFSASVQCKQGRSVHASMQCKHAVLARLISSCKHAVQSCSASKVSQCKLVHACPVPNLCILQA